MRKLNLNFSYTFDGKIWNILSHPDRNILLFEVRSHDKLLTTFSLLDTATGKFIFRDLEFEEKWWIGASLMVDDLIIFHTYPDQENPEIRDIFGYDFVKRQLLWEIKKKNLTGFGRSYVAVTDPEGTRDGDETYYELYTGKQKASADEEKVDGIEKNKLLESTFHYRQGTPYFETVSGFINNVTGKSIVKGADYYENGQIMAMSFYYWAGKEKLANDLLVVDHEGNNLLNLTLGHNLSGISDNTFFVFYNKLIFVKDSSDLMMYQLP